MPIPSNAAIVSAIKSQLTSIDFDEAPVTDELITAVVAEIMSAVKAATVTTIVVGTLAPPTTVSGTGTGDPGTGTGLN